MRLPSSLRELLQIEPARFDLKTLDNIFLSGEYLGTKTNRGVGGGGLLMT